MRAIVYRFDSFDELSLRLEAGGDDQDLDLARELLDGSFRDGEWVLGTFSVGEQCTAIAACVTDRGEGPCLAFEDRDWEELWRFAQGDGPPTLPPPAPDTGAPPPDTSILLVDDDSELRTVVGALLEASGHHVVSVASAEDALDRLRDTPYDLLILDWNLPGMTGLELCRRLRGAQTRVPVLFLTAHASDHDIVQAFDAGADDFVSKPFRVPELCARVVGLLRRSELAPLSHRMPR